MLCFVFLSLAVLDCLGLSSLVLSYLVLSSFVCLDFSDLIASCHVVYRIVSGSAMTCFFVSFVLFCFVFACVV